MQSGGLYSSFGGLLKVALAAFWHGLQSILGSRVGSLSDVHPAAGIFGTYLYAMRL